MNEIAAGFRVILFAGKAQFFMIPSIQYYHPVWYYRKVVQVLNIIYSVLDVNQIPLFVLRIAGRYRGHGRMRICIW